MATLEVPATPVSLAAAVPIAGAPACPSCGTVLAGEFCHACGERRHADERFSARHFFADAWEDVFDLDSRALRSLRMLVLQPGVLTLEALRGRRRPYVGALRMYIVVFAATLFLATVLPERDEGNSATRMMGMLGRLIHTLALRRGISDQAAREALERAMVQHISWLTVLIPVIFAVFLLGMFRLRRPWYGQHLLFATHFATLNTLAGLVAVPFQHLLSASAVTVLSVALLVPITAWMMIAVRRVYATGWPGAAGATLLLFITFSISNFIVSLLAICTSALSVLYLNG